MLLISFLITIANLWGLAPTGIVAITNNDEPAVRVVRFSIHYSNVDVPSIAKHQNWSTIMRKSVLASLRFVNKHWLICGDQDSPDRDPVKNTKVDATSTVYGVIQIGLRGGIFQYTNAMKLLGNIGIKNKNFLGKPNPELDFEEAFFCYPGFQLQNHDKCQKINAHRHRRHRLSHRSTNNLKSNS